MPRGTKARSRGSIGSVKSAGSGHNPSGRIAGYAYCKKCGLVYLRNDVTTKAIAAPCPGDER